MKHVVKKAVKTPPPVPKKRPTAVSQLNSGADTSALFDELFG